MSVYSKARSSKLLVGILKAIFRLKVTGSEKEPADSGFIICANHMSNADPIILGVAIKGSIRFMAKKELFRVPVLSWFIKLFGAYSVDRKNSDAGAVKMTINILKNGENVGLYPQARRIKGKNPTGMPVMNGAALIAMRAGCGILPVTIKTKKFKSGPFRKTEAIIHDFVPYEAIMEKAGSPPDYRKVMDEIFAVICEPLN